MRSDSGPRAGLAQAYAATRERFLATATTALAEDARIVAAWLGGSYGRRETDALSDVDLFCAVTDGAAQELCVCPWQAAAETIPARLALFSRFGEPAAIHENNGNAPAGGTFTFVMYRHSSLAVDWTLVPVSQAVRPGATVLLFDRTAALAAPPSATTSASAHRTSALSPSAALRERIAFFWLIAAVTAKYTARGNKSQAIELVQMLHEIVADITALMRGIPVPYRAASLQVAETSDPVTAIRDLIPGVVAAAHSLRADDTPVLLPLEELDLWLRMAQE